MKIGKGYFWNFPVHDEDWTLVEDKMHEKLLEFIRYAEKVLEKKGYCILKHDMFTRGSKTTEMIYVGRPDIVKRYLSYWNEYYGGEE